MKKLSIQRFWINQPSTHDLFHKYHGLRVFAGQYYEDRWDVLFLFGDYCTMVMPRSALSKGWPDTSVFEKEIKC